MEESDGIGEPTTGKHWITRQKPNTSTDGTGHVTLTCYKISLHGHDVADLSTSHAARVLSHVARKDAPGAEDVTTLDTDETTDVSARDTPSIRAAGAPIRRHLPPQTSRTGNDYSGQDPTHKTFSSKL